MEKTTKLLVRSLKDLNGRINSADLGVCDGGVAYINEDWKNDDVNSVYSRLYYIIEGSGAHIEGKDEHIEMLPGHIYLIPSGYRYRYWCDGYVKKVYFHINIKRNDGYDAFSKFGRFGEIYDPDAVKRVAELYEGDDVFAPFALKGEIFTSVVHIAEKYGYDISKDDNKKYSKIIRMATEYIQRNLSIKLTRNEIAECCNVSPGTIAKCFKNELGLTVGKYIDDLVFMEATRRLIYTDDPIGIISEEMGFCDQFYFSRRFSELYEITPLKYRHKMQNDK